MPTPRYRLAMTRWHATRYTCAATRQRRLLAVARALPAAYIRGHHGYARRAFNLLARHGIFVRDRQVLRTPMLPRMWTIQLTPATPLLPWAFTIDLDLMNALLSDNTLRVTDDTRGAYGLTIDLLNGIAQRRARHDPTRPPGHPHPLPPPHLRPRAALAGHTPYGTRPTPRDRARHPLTHGARRGGPVAPDGTPHNPLTSQDLPGCNIIISMLHFTQ